MIYQLTGPRQYSADLSQGGLEILCSLIFMGDDKEIQKIRSLTDRLAVQTLCSNPLSHPQRNRKRVIVWILKLRMTGAEAVLMRPADQSQVFRAELE